MNKERTIIALTVVAHGLTHVAELTFPATATLAAMAFFGRADKYADIGLAASVAGFGFGFAAIPSGWLVDRLGPRRVLLLFLFGTGASLFALAAMPSFAAFTVALAALGFFSGLYHPAGTAMITLGLEKHGQALGAHGMGGNLGLALTPFLAAALASALGFRVAYAIIGGLPVLLGLFVLAAKIKVGGKREALVREESVNPAERPLRRGPLLLLFTMAAFNGMAYRGLMTFLPAYFGQRVHLAWLPLKAVTTGGTITTAVLGLGIVGQMVGGILADRLNKEKLFAAIFGVSSLFLLALGQLQDLPLILAAALFAFLYFMNQPVANAIIPRYAPPRILGQTFGLFFFMTFGAGAIMSWIAGIVGEKYQLRDIFFMLAASLLVASGVGFFLVRKTRGLDISG